MLPNLKFFILYTNQLSGTLPNLTAPNLITFDAHQNKFTGAIPNFNLPKIINLVLDNNLLTTVPNFNTMPTLQNLDLSTNQLAGSIPSLTLPALKSLNLAINKLTGGIPTFNLPNLTGLILSNNLLSGCLPASLRAFCSINVDISGNLSLSNQNFATFCANNTGACVPTSNEDITLAISSTPSVYQQFQTNNFRITAKNSKATALANVKIEFKFPAKTVSGGTAVASTGTWQEWCSGGVPCYTWTIPNLAAGTTATLNVPLFILDATAPIVTTTKVLAATPQASSNVATVTVNRASAPTTQSLAFQVPTQRVPVVIQAISPNPTESNIIIKLDSWTKQDVDFNFSDIAGKTILSEKRTLDKGLNRVAFDVNYLPQGVYFIQTNVGKGTNVPTKFVKM